MEDLSLLLCVTVAVVAISSLALFLADSLLLLDGSDGDGAGTPPAETAANKNPARERAKVEDERGRDDIGNGEARRVPGSPGELPEGGGRRRDDDGGWKCACEEGGGLLLPQSMMKSICGPRAAFSLSTGGCYHKQL